MGGASGGIACSLCVETNNAWQRGEPVGCHETLAMGENDDASRHKVFLNHHSQSPTVYWFAIGGGLENLRDR